MEGDDPWTSLTRHDSCDGHLQIRQAKDRQLRGCPLPASSRTSHPRSSPTPTPAPDRLRANTRMGQTIRRAASGLQRTFVNETIICKLIYLFMTASVFQTVPNRIKLNSSEFLTLFLIHFDRFVSSRFKLASSSDWSFFLLTQQVETEVLEAAFWMAWKVSSLKSFQRKKSSWVFAAVEKFRLKAINKNNWR